MNILQTISSRLASLIPGGGRKGSSVIGVDIGSASIKVVQLRRNKGKAVLETYGEISLGPYGGVEIGQATRLPSGKTADALVDLIRESNVTATTAGISIPFSSSLTSIFQMPPMGKEQLDKMVPLEARKYIPVSMSDVVLDWFVIPQGEEYATSQKQEPKQEILLVAIHNETLKNYQDVSKAAALATQFYELEVFGAIRAALGHGIAPVMLVDIGASTTKVYIIERGVIRVSHLISIGGQDLTLAISRSLGWDFKKSERVKYEAGILAGAHSTGDDNVHVREALLSTLGRIFSEVNRVLLSYGKKYNRNVATTVLTGGGAGLPGLIEYANQEIESDVELSDPFNKIEAPAFLEDVLKEVGPEFSVAVGVALRLMQGES